jgi:predicted MFS family arabinose efflux permease
VFTILGAALYYGVYVCIIKLLLKTTKMNRAKCDDKSCFITPMLFMAAAVTVIYYGKPSLISFVFLKCWIGASILAGGILLMTWMNNRTTGEEFSNAPAVLITIFNTGAAIITSRSGMIDSFRPW